MLSTFVQFCTEWIGTDPRWSKAVAILIVFLVLVAPRKLITIKKTSENKWIIFLR